MIAQYFTKDEFKCKCGKCNCNGDLDSRLVRLLDAMRDAYGKPIVISSAIRCQTHNTNVGSRDTSSHITRCAVDIKINNSQERLELVRIATIAGFNRIGVGETFIHLDVDPFKIANVLWVY